MTTLTAIKRNVIETALELASVDYDGIRPDYSGRGMYGETCLGITFDDYGQLATFLVELTGLFAETTMDDEEPCVYDVIQPARDLARKLRTDSMGYQVIAYWPGIEIED